ncbi:APC family permease [Jhaorihella thermophila]
MTWTGPTATSPRAIYWAVAAATTIYVVLAIGAIAAIPFDDLIAKQEYALAAGASDVLGPVGEYLVIAGALLATMSAISGTLYGASRQMAAIARDGYLPPRLAERSGGIPRLAVAAMAICAMGLIVIGSLRLILEFGSITFLLVCFLMALTNHAKRGETGAHPWATVLSMTGLGAATVLILIYEAQHSPEQLAFVLTIYAVLTVMAAVYAHLSGRLRRPDAPPKLRRG